MNLYQTLGDLFNEFSKIGRKRFGYLGELAAAMMLQKSGYRVDFCRQGMKCGDLVAAKHGTVKKIECKIARRSLYDRKWHFTLTSTGNGKTDYRHADYIVLLVVHDVTGFVTPFVIPVAEAGQRCQICITSEPSSYSGMWAKYRQSAHRGLSL